MATVSSLRDEVLRGLRARTDAAYLAKIRELVPSGAPILGVQVPVIRDLVKTFASAHGKLDPATLVALVDAQFKGRCREEMLFGVFALERFKKQLDATLWSKVDEWIDAIDNWEVCDQLAKGVASHIIVKNLALLTEMKRWTQSRNPWRRRFTVAATTALNQKGRSYPEVTLAMCAPLVAEPEVIVQKAVGWALREACKSDERAVFEFLSTHRARMHPRILREGSEKLTAAHRRALRDA